MESRGSPDWLRPPQPHPSGDAIWVTHHTDAVIEQGLPEDHHVKLLVHASLLEHSQHRHGVHRRDQATEQQVLQQVDVAKAEGFDLADEVEGETNAKGIDQGPQACPPQDGANVLKEGPRGHEVAALQHDGRKEIQEVNARIHDWRRFVVGAKDDAAHQRAHDDEEAALWHEVGQLVVKVETWAHRRPDINLCR